MADNKPIDDWEDIPLDITPEGVDDWEEVPLAEDPGALEGFKEGAASALTFGFSNELTAAARSTFGDVTYADALKEEQKEMEDAERLQSGAFGAGEIAGTVGSFILPGGAAVKGAGLLAKTAKGVAVVSKAKKASTAAKTAAKAVPSKLKEAKAFVNNISPENKAKFIKTLKNFGMDAAIDLAAGFPGAGAIGKTVLRGAMKFVVKK